MPLPPVCPVCAALLLESAVTTHLVWHEVTGTLNGFTRETAEERIRDAARWTTFGADDEAPTQKFPPITETVLRRPPPVPVRELRGPDLLRALAAEIERDLQSDDEDQGDEDQGDDAGTLVPALCDRRRSCFLTRERRGACPCGSVL